MSPGRGRALSSRAVTDALARRSYARDVVRLASRDLTGCEHLASTRRGLFAVSPEHCRLIAHGQYFGLTVVGNLVLAFEACDAPVAESRMGRIVAFRVEAGRIAGTDVVARGLDNGCHQIDVLGRNLVVVDTYGQRLVTISRSSPRDRRPLPDAPRGDWAAGYSHMNALIADDRQTFVLLHNGADHTGRASEVLLLDPDWKVRDRRTVPGAGCHDLAVLESGELLLCGSWSGELIGMDGPRAKVTDMMTRGLSVGADSIVVGGSPFAERTHRDGQAGEVCFLDRQYRVQARTRIPSGPTALCRIDGQDLALTGHVRRLGLRVLWPD